MTAKPDYTDAEWTLLLSAMAMVGFGMMAVSRSGTIGKLRELTVLFTCLTTERMPPEFQQNELVMALVQDFHAVAPPRAMPAISEDQTRATSGIAAAPRTMIACCEKVAFILASKTPSYEAEGYKRWLMWIAGTVAEFDINWMARRQAEDHTRRRRADAAYLRGASPGAMPT